MKLDWLHFYYAAKTTINRPVFYLLITFTIYLSILPQTPGSDKPSLYVLSKVAMFHPMYDSDDASNMKVPDPTKQQNELVVKLIRHSMSCQIWAEQSVTCIRPF